MNPFGHNSASCVKETEQTLKGLKELIEPKMNVVWAVTIADILQLRVRWWKENKTQVLSFKSKKDKLTQIMILRQMITN